MLLYTNGSMCTAFTHTQNVTHSDDLFFVLFFEFLLAISVVAAKCLQIVLELDINNLLQINHQNKFSWYTFLLISKQAALNRMSCEMHMWMWLKIRAFPSLRYTTVYAHAKIYTQVHVLLCNVAPEFDCVIIPFGIDTASFQLPTTLIASCFGVNS